MKRFAVGTILIFAATVVTDAHATKIKFEGRVTQATFAELNGRNCSITLRSIKHDKGATTKIEYVARPRIEGEVYSERNQEKPPVPKIWIRDPLGEGRSHELVGLGSKHPKATSEGDSVDLSQRLFVEFDPSMTRVLAYRYSDPWYGNEFQCR